MKTRSDIRGQVIGHLVNAYTLARSGELTEGALAVDAEPPDWSVGNLIEAYGDIAGMFVYFGLEMERQYGADFLRHLQEQALVFARDDPPSLAPL